MKSIYLLLLLLSTKAIAQKEDYNWLIGYSGYSKDPVFGITRLQFDDKDSLRIISEEKSPITFYASCAAISDKKGQLAIYSNSNVVMNASHDSLEGGRIIKQQTASNMQQNIVILPFPEKDSLYLIVHQEPGPFFVPPNHHVAGAMETYYSIVDMSKNNGKGKVIERAKKLTNKVNYFGYGHITAVKQPNGINWWIFLFEPWYNKMHRFELTKEGVTYVDEQLMNINMIEGVGGAVFSPDATKYVMFIDESPQTDRFIDIFDFDRCKGQLKHKERIILGKRNGWGVSISPNSRFLYVSMIDELFQYDLRADVIAPTRKIVAKRDGFKDGIVILSFENLQLAPDNKIYVSTTSSGTRYLHVIERPDLEDTLCKVNQHAIFLPTYNSFALPYFPNFRQKAFDCTIATKDENTSLLNFSIFPNPTFNKQITIESKQFEFKDCIFNLFKIEGELILSKPIQDRKTNISLPDDLPNGIYFWRVYDVNKQIGQGKLIIIE